VKDLLQHDFFLDDNGLRLEIVKTEDSEDQSVQLQLRVVDPKKRKDKHKENEAIQFGFDCLDYHYLNQNQIGLLHFLYACLFFS
jgi:hypothetical protein